MAYEVMAFVSQLCHERSATVLCTIHQVNK